MSPRAAARLESLGFRQVYDYVAGEADWFASGLPMEGANVALQSRPQRQTAPVARNTRM